MKQNCAKPRMRSVTFVTEDENYDRYLVKCEYLFQRKTHFSHDICFIKD